MYMNILYFKIQGNTIFNIRNNVDQNHVKILVFVDFRRIILGDGNPQNI